MSDRTFVDWVVNFDAECRRVGVKRALQEIYPGTYTPDVWRGLDQSMSGDVQGQLAAIRAVLTLVAAPERMTRADLLQPWAVEFIATRCALSLKLSSPLMSNVDHYVLMMRHVFSAQLNTYVLATQHGAANVFRMSDGIVSALTSTDIAGVHPSEVRLPFPGMYVQLPPSLEYTEGGRAMELAEWLDGDRRQINVRVYGTRQVAGYVLDMDGEQITSQGAPVVGEDQALARLAINFVLYVNSPTPDVRPASNAKNTGAWDEAITASRTSPRAPGRRPGSRMLWDVGASVQRLRVAVLDVLVRGHWRRQSHGPRHTLRKMIWVRPHVRMATGAPVAGHDYEVAS